MGLLGSVSLGFRVQSSKATTEGEQVTLVPDEKANHPLSLQRANKGSKVMERLRKKLSEQESLLLLMSPSMAFRVHSRNGKVSASLSADSHSRLPSPPHGCLCYSLFLSISTGEPPHPTRDQCSMSHAGTRASDAAEGSREGTG